MKITKIEVVYPSYKASLRTWRPNLWQIITRVHTDNSKIFGYGTGGGGLASVNVIKGHLSDLVINQNIESIEDIKTIFEELYKESIPYGRGGIASMAISSIDLAIWDAYSKYYETPIKNLIEENTKNHVSKIKTYATGNDVEIYNKLGFINYKLSVRSSEDFKKDKDTLVKEINGIRNKFQNTQNIMLDSYMSWDIEYTMKMSKSLSDLDIYWFEDVSTPDQMLNSKSFLDELNGIFLAGGEHDLNYENFSIMKNNNTYNFWQPDITWCGGISALLKIILISSGKYPIILHRGGEPWGLPLIQSGKVENLAEIHSPYDKKISMEQWNNNSVMNFDEGILELNNYLGFGAEPKERIFNE